MAPYETIPGNAKTQPSKFTVNTPQEAIDEFHHLLKVSKIAPETYEATLGPSKLGVTREWLLNTKAAWEKYDWRKTEEYINSFPNYKLPIKSGSDTLNLHFVALFSENPDAIPLLLLHGWPGSFLEFLPIVQLLKKQYTPETLPYHLIIPSQPGYAFSSTAPISHEFTIENTAECFHQLLTELGLGEAYIVQGGDIGSRIARIMGVKYKACKGVHTNFCFMQEPESVKGQSYNAREQAGLARYKDFTSRGSAYSFEHATRPSTLGFALAASPIALLAWVGEKFLTWVDEPLSLDHILDDISLYWYTESIARSFYPYRTNWVSDDIGSAGNPKWKLEGFGYSSFPQELANLPRSWIETTGDLVFYREHDKGGHFAALEQPEVLLKDIVDYIEQVWKP